MILLALFEKKREIHYFLFIYCLSRIFILFLPGHVIDLLGIIQFLYGPTPLSQVNNYPPFIFLQFELILSIFGKTLVGYRIGFILYEFGTIIILYKFVQRFHEQEFHKSPSEATSAAISACYIYAFSPFILFSYLIFAEFIANFFMMLGLYAYYTNKATLGSFFVCLGFLTEFYPIFCLVPIIINMLIHKRFKDLAKIIASFLITFVVANFILWFTFSSNIFGSYITQFSRTQTFSLWEIIKIYLPTWNLYSLFNLIDISPVGLTFIVVFISYCIYLIVHFNRNKAVTQKQELIWYLFLSLLLPAVFLSLLPRYILFGFPVFCLFVETKMTIMKQKKLFLILTAVIIFFSIISLVVWPDLTLTTPTAELELILNEHELNLPLFNLIIGFNVCIGVIWLTQSKQWFLHRIKREQPTSLDFYNYVFLLFMVQFALVPFVGPNIATVLVIVIFTWGLIFLLWIAKRIFPKSDIYYEDLSP